MTPRKKVLPGRAPCHLAEREEAILPPDIKERKDQPMSFTAMVPLGQIMSFPYCMAGGGDAINVILTQSAPDGTPISTNTQTVTLDDPLPEVPDALSVFAFSGAVVVTVTATVGGVECNVTSIEAIGQVNLVQFGLESIPGVTVLALFVCQVIPAAG